MKKYILTDDLQCRYLAKSKKDLIDYVKMNYKSWKYDEIEKIKDCDIYFIKYNWNRIEIDDYFWDILAIDKKNRDDWYIEYDDYVKYWIKDWLCKKDFLYHNL
jgi:hypothetical protein